MFLLCSLVVLSPEQPGVGPGRGLLRRSRSWARRGEAGVEAPHPGPGVHQQAQQQTSQGGEHWQHNRASTKVCQVTITEKVHTRASSWLRHY